MTLDDPNTTSLDVGIGPNRTWYYRIRTLFRSGDDEDDALAHGRSAHSPVIVGTTVKDPDDTLPRLRTADARGKEGVDDSVDFRVELHPAATETVTVDYATADRGDYDYVNSATAGEDYRARSGTLVFRPGQTEKTVEVPIHRRRRRGQRRDVLVPAEQPVGGRATPGCSARS